MFLQARPILAILAVLIVLNYFLPSALFRVPLGFLVGFFCIIGLIYGIGRIAEWRLKRGKSPEEWQAFLAEHAAAQRRKENEEREKQYLDAIAGPRKWCLMAMREGRNFTRQQVAAKDLDDILAWAAANDIAVTEMDRILDDVRLSFGELRRAKKTARFLGESF